MKKLYIFLFILCSITLIACSNQNNLDGEYYDIYDGEAELVLEFDGSGGRFYKEGAHAITDIDSTNKSFTFSANGRECVATYNLNENGSLHYNTGDFMTGSNSFTVYKKDREAYKDALKNQK